MSSYHTLTKRKTLGLVALLSVGGVQSANANFNKTIENALKFGQDDAKYGQIKLNLRYRYENHDTDIGPKKTGDTDTLRWRIGYLSPEFHGVQAFAEYEGNQDIFTNEYNSVRNGKTGFETVADPQEHELNQLWVSYKGIPDTEIKLGRQRIKIDNDRFIGNVGWRQMEQTYDAVMITNKSLPNTTLKAGYIINQRDIFARENDMDSQFVNLAYDIKGIGKVTGYTYLVDYNEAAGNNRSSNQTYGARFNGAYKVNDDVKALYTAEYAWQRDHGDNPLNYQVDYFNVMGGVAAFGITLKAGVEQLGGQKGKGFDTPLATKHAFQGWADKFLGTPGDGIRDISVALSGKIKGVKIMGVYHDFDDDTGSINYGQEYDFVVATKIAKHYSLLAKYAYYDADQFSTDTQKFWLQAGVSF